MSFEFPHTLHTKEAGADAAYETLILLDDALTEAGGSEDAYQSLRHTLKGAQQRMMISGLVHCIEQVEDFTEFARKIVDAAHEGRVVELDQLSDALWNIVETYDPLNKDKEHFLQSDIDAFKEAYFDVIRYDGNREVFKEAA